MSFLGGEGGWLNVPLSWETWSWSWSEGIRGIIRGVSCVVGGSRRRHGMVSQWWLVSSISRNCQSVTSQLYQVWSTGALSVPIASPNCQSVASQSPVSVWSTAALPVSSQSAVPVFTCQLSVVRTRRIDQRNTDHAMLSKGRKKLLD